MRKALIIGAVPAGLTAAFEFVHRSDIQPVVLEKNTYMGGISCTLRYKDNRIDIGGHRFFSKSDRVMEWWMRVMPVEAAANGTTHNITLQSRTRSITPLAGGPDPRKSDRVMLIRNRKSRIYFLRRFFDYPIQINSRTLRHLGPLRVLKIGISYTKALLLQIKPEKTLEQFLINHFGKELYRTFFKSYTEKVWGVTCDRISAEWGAQRIKGLSIKRAIGHFLRKRFASRPAGDIAQKGTETSLIEKFMYPKLGPGQLWEYVAEDIKSKGAVVKTGWQVDKLRTSGFHIVAAEAFNAETGEREIIEADYFFSTMPIKEDSAQGARLLSDNWIYVQEPDVQVGRMQIFNNWSPYMVADPENVWIGLEYFCYETDDIWKLPDADMIEFAKAEMEKIGVIDRSDVLDACVIRVPKTYPAYFGAYEHFEVVKTWISRFDNLFLVGRNGMHKYNNQDHSMLTAMTAVDNILEGRVDKSNIWALNTEMEYHESKDGK